MKKFVAEVMKGKHSGVRSRNQASMLLTRHRQLDENKLRGDPVRIRRTENNTAGAPDMTSELSYFGALTWFFLADETE